MTENNDNLSYRKTSAIMEDWFKLHFKENFTLDFICRDLKAETREERRLVAEKLNNESTKKEPRFVKDTTYNTPIYKWIDRNIKIENFLDYKVGDYANITFPSNHQSNDLSYFGFSDIVKIPKRSLIVVAGVSNAGKSLFQRNLAIDNMDSMPVRYMSSETTPDSMAEYARNMSWANCVVPGSDPPQPKFEFIERYRDFADIIKPDALNLVDWLNVETGEWYRIGYFLEQMLEKLTTGIVVVAIQKDPHKDLGRGDSFSMEKATLYITMDFKEHPTEDKKYINWLTIKKAKKWVGRYNPYNAAYGFEIVNEGSQFANIREIKKCRSCNGLGTVRHDKCITCDGSGIIDGFRVTHAPKQPELEVENEPPY